MSYGAIYAESWFGNANESNGWGALYPYDVDGSFFTVDSTKETADSTLYSADATEF